MKISVLQHDPKAHLPQRKGDTTPITRNLDPLAHPFARARERNRALNAAKIERMFSKPFVASLEGHIDGVYTLATKAGDLETITSGSSDGEIIVHDLASQQHLLKFPGAHKGTVSAITYADGPRLLSCGVDRTVKLWDTSLSSGEEEAVTRAPLNVFPGKVAFNAIDHHRTDQLFATASNIVQLWDETRSSPISDLTFPTSNETVTALRFNLSESSILATTGGTTIGHADACQRP
ncbi:Protein SOF1 OS=Saccharomyces cerevisiae (strain ATCC 204508 / S288c) GN=SOF1 PE=1 SV=1 [Rhizoctonia solani AG-1 IB]|uniref:Protein SOF1 n=1 Tax=Thanatephorus cucumeris (strain AG1-IB / isolate 7/3/14) TaxID=1108050 RepID=A0A0B7FYI7_THACB|nr:Protein SOF1 OS=Saccharomyces cerevisiae (strain ATCC 204508 / S288c) GN=SOF1 PE=1 SV=1 [Rhizoctonia solani AG-1 IB]